MLQISNNVAIPDHEIKLSAVRAQGAGGQNINKVSSAIHLRFNILESSLPELYKQRLMHLKDHRISKEGVIIIKAQQSRSQEQNRVAALERLRELIRSVAAIPKPRRPTRPTKASTRKRLDQKTQRGKVKALRRKVEHD